MKGMGELSDLVTELPVVPEGKSNSVLVDYLQNEKYMQEKIKEIHKKNRYVVSSLYDYIKDLSPGPALYVGISVYNLLESEGQLPEVTLDIMEEVLTEFKQTKKDEYVYKFIENPTEETREVVNFMNKFSEQFKNPIEVKAAGVLVYNLLKKQTEFNKSKINYKK